jgi:hypothetical protein
VDDDRQATPGPGDRSLGPIVEVLGLTPGEVAEVERQMRLSRVRSGSQVRRLAAMVKGRRDDGETPSP